MQPPVQHGARLRQVAASDRGNDEGVLDDLALGVAAADANDIGQHRLELVDASPVIATRKGVQRPEDLWYRWPGDQLSVGQTLLDQV